MGEITIPREVENEMVSSPTVGDADPAPDEKIENVKRCLLPSDKVMVTYPVRNNIAMAKVNEELRTATE